MKRISPKSIAQQEWVKNTITPSTDIPIDELMRKGLSCIDKTLKHLMQEAAEGQLCRESIMNLKDCMSMLHELKKREADLLDEMSDAELEKLAGEQK